MRILLIGVLTVGLLESQPNAVRADDIEARKILEKAVAAHGGKKLATATGLHYKWTSSTGDGDSKVVNTSERWVDFPDRVLGVAEVTIGKVSRDVTSGYDGKVAWLKAGGKITALDAARAKSFRETVFNDRVMSLTIVQEKDARLSIVGEAKVHDRPVVGIRLERKSGPDVNLYFDKKSGLLVKAEWRAKNLEGVEVTEEHFFAEHKESGGVKYPSRVTIHQDGKQTQAKELTEYELLQENLGAGHFARPKK